MKALCWNGKNTVAVEEVPDPRIEHPRDAIIKITSTAICGSDLHLYDGLVQTLKYGDILGHEPMGEVVEVGPEVGNLQVGDRVVVPFTISCGQCLFCKQTLFSLCDESNPNRELAEKVYGSSPAGLFGFSHMYGGFAGGQAQYLRVPFADVGPIVIPEHLPDEKVLFLSDIFPTGWMAAENCDIQPGDIVAIWGGGPVGRHAQAHFDPVVNHAGIRPVRFHADGVNAGMRAVAFGHAFQLVEKIGFMAVSVFFVVLKIDGFRAAFARHFQTLFDVVNDNNAPCA